MGDVGNVLMAVSDGTALVAVVAVQLEVLLGIIFCIYLTPSCVWQYKVKSVEQNIGF